MGGSEGGEGRWGKDMERVFVEDGVWCGGGVSSGQMIGFTSWFESVLLIMFIHCLDCIYLIHYCSNCFVSL